MRCAMPRLAPTESWLLGVPAAVHQLALFSRHWLNPGHDLCFSGSSTRPVRLYGLERFRQPHVHVVGGKAAEGNPLCGFSPNTEGQVITATVRQKQKIEDLFLE